MTEPSEPARIRPAAPDDALDIRRVLDAAVLEFAALEPRIAANDVLVARNADGRVRGAIVLEPEVSAVVTEGLGTGASAGGLDGTNSPDESGAHVDAIAVRRRHRGRGIGSTLVERALDREGRLTAHFDDGVRPFYEALGFEIVSLDDERFAGVRER